MGGEGGKAKVILTLTDGTNQAQESGYTVTAMHLRIPVNQLTGTHLSCQPQIITPGQ